MIVEVSTLDQVDGPVGIEEADALTAKLALAGIDETFRPIAVTPGISSMRN